MSTWLHAEKSIIILLAGDFFSSSVRLTKYKYLAQLHFWYGKKNIMILLKKVVKEKKSIFESFSNT